MWLSISMEYLQFPTLKNAIVPDASQGLLETLLQILYIYTSINVV